MMQDLEHCAVTDGEPDRGRFAPIFGCNVKRFRTEAKINKKRFALMVGIGRPFLNKIEDGEANPRLDVIVRIADALGKTPCELMEEPPEEPAAAAMSLEPPVRDSRCSEVRHSRLQ